MNDLVMRYHSYLLRAWLLPIIDRDLRPMLAVVEYYGIACCLYMCLYGKPRSIK